MKYVEIVEGASKEEAEYLDQFKSNAVILDATKLPRYQYIQFKYGKYVRPETRAEVEKFYRKQLEQTERVIAIVERAGKLRGEAKEAIERARDALSQGDE